MDKPQSWPPIPKDCSQIYCSYYCPQWCFFLFPPPPPPPPLSSSSHPLLSPLLIAVISITATGFLLAAYYILLTQYRRRRNHPTRSAPLPENQPESWHGTQPGGLDQTLINKITACQYRAGAGLIVDGTDCSVCLGQFEDGDRIRLLPKCSHPFHVPCIDTWLKSHSTCPLCRAGVFPRADEALAVVVEEILDPGPTTLTDDSGSERETVVGVEVSERSGRLFGRSFSMDLPFQRGPVSEPDRVKRSWSLPSGERSSSESQHDASC